jgi:hypothetical protein
MTSVDTAPVPGQNAAMSIPVSALNHAVLFVRDATVAAEFYGRVFSVGPTAQRAPRGSVGLYHLAWEVPTIEDLADAARILSEAGALGGASDHGVSKSLYGHDPDGNEFEIMWRVPRESWGEHEEHGSILPLDLDAEVRTWGSKA